MLPARSNVMSLSRSLHFFELTPRSHHVTYVCALLTSGVVITFELPFSGEWYDDTEADDPSSAANVDSVDAFVDSALEYLLSVRYEVLIWLTVVTAAVLTLRPDG